MADAAGKQIRLWRRRREPEYDARKDDNGSSSGKAKKSRPQARSQRKVCCQQEDNKEGLI
jgi:hypothetical protein